MGKQAKKEAGKEAFGEKAEEMYERLREWREGNAEASFDEIAKQVGEERKQLMGGLLSELAMGYRRMEAPEYCWECGGRLEAKGEKRRGVLHREGEAKIEREHYYCPGCAGGIFPLDEQLGLTRHSWSEETIRLALRQAVGIPSYQRGAESFEALTGVPLSKSALQRLVMEYGGKVVEEEEAEARAMVRIPKPEEEVIFRKPVKPDSETMAVSADGAMIRIREEGWKEVKVVSVSAVTSIEGEDEREGEVELNQHSYRAGLWDAKTFTNHYWAESCRRGVEQAKNIVCVNDGALWIWALAFICFPRRIEILDWYHALEYVWQIVLTRWPAASPQAQAWMASQKSALFQAHFRPFFHAIRILYPRGSALPEAVSHAIGYLFRNRSRMDYAAFRLAGFPVGSGTVESAAKTLVQQRLKQAGMQWSRDGAQSMLALRSRLLSHRWHSLSLASSLP